MASSNPDVSPQKTEELQGSGAKMIKSEDSPLSASPELSGSKESLSTSPKKDAALPLAAMVQELDESQSELLSRIRGLKQNVQSWRSTVDTQLKSYKDELSGLKKQLETELEQLSLDFKELKTTLQKQQEDVAISLKHLGLQDVPKHSEEPKTENQEDSSDKAQDSTLDSKDETSPAAGSSE